MTLGVERINPSLDLVDVRREIAGHRRCDFRIRLLSALRDAIAGVLVYTQQQARRVFVARDGCAALMQVGIGPGRPDTGIRGLIVGYWGQYRNKRVNRSVNSPGIIMYIAGPSTGLVGDGLRHIRVRSNGDILQDGMASHTGLQTEG